MQCFSLFQHMWHVTQLTNTERNLSIMENLQIDTVLQVQVAQSAVLPIGTRCYTCCASLPQGKSGCVTMFKLLPKPFSSSNTEARSGMPKKRDMRLQLIHLAFKCPQNPELLHGTSLKNYHP